MFRVGVWSKSVSETVKKKKKNSRVTRWKKVKCWSWKELHRKLVQRAQVPVSVYLQLFHMVNAVVPLGH